MLLKHPDLVHKMSFQILEVEKSQDPNVLGVALHIEIHVIESLVWNVSSGPGKLTGNPGNPKDKG